jgi:hypothetical protein
MATKDDRTVLERFREFVMMEGSAPHMLVEALDDLDHHYRSFDLRWSADVLAIARWRQAAPSRELTWPDHADLVVWLLSDGRAARRGQPRVAAEGAAGKVDAIAGRFRQARHHFWDGVRQLVKHLRTSGGVSMLGLVEAWKAIRA